MPPPNVKLSKLDPIPLKEPNGGDVCNLASHDITLETRNYNLPPKETGNFVCEHSYIEATPRFGRVKATDRPPLR